MSKLNTLDDLFVHELRDIYSAEKQITKALPKMVKAADNTELRDGFQLHLEQTREQIARLEQIFQQLGKSSKGEMCKGMQGLLIEGSKMIEEDAGEAVRDAGLIGAAQRVEHYEIAAYGTARTYAKMLGNQQAYDLLSQTLEEEKQTDEKLTEVAQTVVNPGAQANPGGESGGSQGSAGAASGASTRGARSSGGGTSRSSGGSSRSGGSKGGSASRGGAKKSGSTAKSMSGQKGGSPAAKSSSSGRSGSKRPASRR